MWTLFIICLVIAAIEFMLIIDLQPKMDIPLYAFLIALLMLFVPGINLIEIITVGVMLIHWCHDGGNLVGSNPVSKFFKLLNRNI